MSWKVTEKEPYGCYDWPLNRIAPWSRPSLATNICVVLFLHCHFPLQLRSQTDGHCEHAQNEREKQEVSRAASSFFHPGQFCCAWSSNRGRGRHGNANIRLLLRGPFIYHWPYVELLVTFWTSLAAHCFLFAYLWLTTVNIADKRNAYLRVCEITIFYCVLSRESVWTTSEKWKRQPCFRPWTVENKI